MFAPNTDVYLLSVPLQIDNKNQLTFENTQAQEDYFFDSSKVMYYFTELQFQRKDGYLRIEVHIENLYSCNYVAYRNNNYGNKWFYAYVTNLEYRNNECTFVYIKTDVFQTWQFNLNYKQSFIEREHIDVSNDIPGTNLLPEGLETGEYKVGGTAEIEDLEPWYIVALAGTSEDWDSGYSLNGIFNGIIFEAFSSMDTLRGWILQQYLGGTQNRIQCIFSLPKLAFYPLDTLAHRLDADIKATPRPVTLASTPNSLDGYTPRNQKLRTYPYMYVGFNPFGGSAKIYRYEDFADGTPRFNIISEINRDPVVQFIPQNYRGATGDSLEDIASLTGYPTISWDQDVFNVWLAQNKNIINNDLNYQQLQWGNNKLDNIKNVANSFGNTMSTIDTDKKTGINNNASAGIQTGLNGLYNGITSYQRNNQNWEYQQKSVQLQIEQQQILPNKSNFGSGSGTILGYGLQSKSVYTRYTIKEQFARRIDKYFDMYGYQTNEVKIPNLNNRPNWNYIKMIGALIEAKIPQDDLEEIKSYFNEGITLWHNPNTFLDYSQNNR